MKWLFSFIFFFIIYNLYFIIPVQAIYDPLSVSNNRFGIHIITADTNEASEAANLVNPNGDWGYVTVLIEQKDRNEGKWQEFFNELRRRHLIPIIRIATQVEGSNWKKPGEDEADNWANFLDNLIWPTKNRYVTIYNEPNHAAEWGGSVDAKNYARVLDQTITALKTKNTDFFVLNAGFDTSAPQEKPSYQDEASFLSDMSEEVPDIFERLDGWVSHAYPQPNFSGPADGSGRGSVKTWEWETQYLKTLGLNKTLPVFITETGWKHAEGLSQNFSFLSVEAVSQNYKRAFLEAWNSNQIVAVTPFLLNYQEDPFDHFSFKKITTGKQRSKLLGEAEVLGSQFSDYYPQYETLRSLPKTAGHPVQENKAELKDSNFYNTIGFGQEYHLQIKVKNTGQSIWGEKGEVKLAPILGGEDLGIEEAKLSSGVKVEPGQEYNFNLRLTPPKLGQFKGSLALFEGGNQFISEPFNFETTVKSPVILNIQAKLAWKKSGAGGYILSFLNGVTSTAQKIMLGENNEAKNQQIRNILPDTDYDFTLSRPYYQPKTIHRRVESGVNILDFGTLEPNIPSAILNPPQLWKLLPLSN